MRRSAGCSGQWDGFFIKDLRSNGGGRVVDDMD